MHHSACQECRGQEQSTPTLLPPTRDEHKAPSLKLKTPLGFISHVQIFNIKLKDWIFLIRKKTNLNLLQESFWAFVFMS